MFLKKSRPTCRVEYEAVVKNRVEHEVVGSDTELSAAVVIAAVRCDDGVQLHLKTDTQLTDADRHRQEALYTVCDQVRYLFGRCRDGEFDWLVSLVVVLVECSPAVQWHYSEGPQLLFTITCDITCDTQGSKHACMVIT